LREDPWAAQEALQQLVELGYIEELEDDKLQQVERAKRENRYYIARNMLNGKRVNQAIEVLEEIFNESKIVRYGQRLAFAYLSKRMYRKCGALLKDLKQIIREEKIAYLKAKNPEKKSDAFENLEFEEPMYLEFIEGLLLLAINKYSQALPILQKIQDKNQNNLQVALQIAQILNQRKKFAEAEKQFIKAISIDPSNQYAHYGLGISFLKRNLFDEAIESFLAAIDFDFYMPNAHFHLGEVLFKKGLFEDASQAFEVAIRIAPGMTKAHKWLLDIYSTKIINPEKAESTKQFLKNNILGQITIISGVQNCNISDVKKMQNRMGISFCDDQQTKDKIKNLHVRTGFLQEYVNKSIFVPDHLLAYLPQNFAYKLIYIDADIIPSDSETSTDTIHLDELQKNLLQRDKIEAWISSQANLKVYYFGKEMSEENRTDFEDFANK
jgi:tetratricopeptide (TPR) repeat protein